MTAPYPFGFIGSGLTRFICLALPSSRVRAFLHPRLDLSIQDITAPGTHPVIFLFQKFSECQFSFPTALRSMSFHEHTICIPFTSVRADFGPFGGNGPYCFMPRLYLDDLWVQWNGIFLWGFSKEMAYMEVNESRYAVRSSTGQPLASLTWVTSVEEAHRPAASCADFEPVRRMLSQKLVSVFPAAMGPCIALSDFDRRWNMASVRPLRVDMEIHPTYIPVIEPGRYSTGSNSRLPVSSVPGSWEFLAPWWLSFPYRFMPPLPQ